MSVLIKGMKMPKSCWDCRMVDVEFSFCHGVDSYDTGNHYTDKERPKWCPLVEIQPHGRLIDADELLMHRFVGVVGEAEKSSYMVGWNSAIEAVVENAHTVIEGEKKRDG